VTAHKEQVHTDGYGEADDKGKIAFKFQAIMLNNKTRDELQDGLSYFVTAGAEFGHGEYVWVAQAEVETNLIPHIYDNSFNLISTSSIARGDSHLFVITTYVTEPSTPLELGVFQPLGFDVKDHFKALCVIFFHRTPFTLEKYRMRSATPSPAPIPTSGKSSTDGLAPASPSPTPH